MVSGLRAADIVDRHPDGVNALVSGLEVGQVGSPVDNDGDAQVFQRLVVSFSPE